MLDGRLSGSSTAACLQARARDEGAGGGIRRGGAAALLVTRTRASLVEPGSLTAAGPRGPESPRADACQWVMRAVTRRSAALAESVLTDGRVDGQGASPVEVRRTGLPGCPGQDSDRAPSRTGRRGRELGDGLHWAPAEGHLAVPGPDG
jgi:hypothetical protein